MFDNDTAFGLRGILILPARQLVDMMSARQYNIDVSNNSGALLIACAAALVLAIVVAAFPDPGA